MTPPDLDSASGMTRRRLVQVGGAAAATIYLAGLTSAAAVAATVAAPAYLRRASYAALRGTTFTASGAAGASVALRLDDVADLVRARTEKALAGRDDAFALTLSGPRATPLAAGSYAIGHASLGSFSLFLAPVGRPSATLQSYEVVVDRSTTLASAQAVAPR